MLKATKKRFDIKITEANSTVSDTFELDKNIVKVHGVLVTSDKDDLLYYRGTQKVEINKEEFFPDNYESKLLMSGINVSPKQRYYDLGGITPGNGRVQISYKDQDDGRTVFTPYRVSLYLDCEMRGRIMMKEQVIITKIKIKRQGERKHFQIKLANDTKFIVGIEYNVRLIGLADGVVIEPREHEKLESVAIGEVRSKTFFKRSRFIGELKLQSCEEANWFYSTDVLESDANISFGDFSQGGFPVNDYTHGNKRTEEIVKIDAESTIIQGWYLDALGKSLKTDIRYEVTVYVWINVEE